MEIFFLAVLAIKPRPSPSIRDAIHNHVTIFGTTIFDGGRRTTFFNVVSVSTTSSV